jgi:hypothetical protein
MKNVFWHYYGYSDTDFKELWNTAMFVFDTSVLLDLYSYSEKTRDEFLDILTNIKDRLWMPYQIGTEYFIKRDDVIHRQRRVYGEIVKMLENLKEAIDDKVKKTLNFKFHPLIVQNDVSSPLIKSIDEVITTIQKREKEHDKLFSKDKVLISLTDLFSGKVGHPYDEARIAEILKDGQKRYASSIPPGYMDSRGDKKKDDDTKFGDLFIWFQIIDKSIADKKPLIFVTNDGTEDWWWHAADNKNLGPRPELLKEMFEKSKNKYYQYNADNFMKYARKHLSAKVEDTSINEAKKVRVTTSSSIGLSSISSENIFGLSKVFNSELSAPFVRPEDLGIAPYNSTRLGYFTPLNSNNIFLSARADQSAFSIDNGQAFGVTSMQDLLKHNPLSISTGDFGIMSTSKDQPKPEKKENSDCNSDK